LLRFALFCCINQSEMFLLTKEKKREEKRREEKKRVGEAHFLRSRSLSLSLSLSYGVSDDELRRTSGGCEGVGRDRVSELLSRSSRHSIDGRACLEEDKEEEAEEARVEEEEE